MTKPGYVQVDKEQLLGEIRERNILVKAVRNCQAVCAKYILPDSKLSAEIAMDELIGILNDKELIKVIKL